MWSNNIIGLFQFLTELNRFRTSLMIFAAWNKLIIQAEMGMFSNQMIIKTILDEILNSSQVTTLTSINIFSILYIL